MHVGMAGHIPASRRLLSDRDQFRHLEITSMRKGVVLRQKMRETIQDDIARRTQMHQAAINRLKIGRAGLAARGLAATAAPQPLVMLSQGDSWFDYPLSGNSVSLTSTDIIAQLTSMGVINPVILNTAHFGDATTVEMSLPKQERMIAALQDPSNWVNDKPDAILFSGGGDDIAGDQFCIYLDYAGPGSTGINAARFQGVLDSVQASYEDLFVFRDKYAPGVPVFAHCYDNPIPNGTHPVCAGPWLKPSLDYCGWNVTQGTSILAQAITDFKAMLVALANNFTLVDTQGVLVPPDWANELHSYPAGFQKLAGKYLDALPAHPGFQGRI
jgi:hypothetical protein